MFDWSALSFPNMSSGLFPRLTCETNPWIRVITASFCLDCFEWQEFPLLTIVAFGNDSEIKSHFETNDNDDDYNDNYMPHSNKLSQTVSASSCGEEEPPVASRMLCLWYHFIWRHAWISSWRRRSLTSFQSCYRAPRPHQLQATSDRLRCEARRCSEQMECGHSDWQLYGRLMDRPFCSWGGLEGGSRGAWRQKGQKKGHSEDGPLIET